MLFLNIVRFIIGYITDSPLICDGVDRAEEGDQRMKCKRREAKNAEEGRVEKVRGG